MREDDYGDEDNDGDENDSGDEDDDEEEDYYGDEDDDDSAMCNLYISDARMLLYAVIRCFLSSSFSSIDPFF